MNRLNDLEERGEIVRTWEEEGSFEKIGVVVVVVMIAGTGSDGRWITGNEEGFGFREAEATGAEREVNGREIEGDGMREGAGGGGICVIGGEGGGAGGDWLDAETRSDHFVRWSSEEEDEDLRKVGDWFDFNLWNEM